MANRVLSSVFSFCGGVGFILGELWGFMRVRKKFWMAPIFLVLLVFGVLIIFVHSPVAVFIYTLF
jgi:hypothetical protein